MNAATKQKPASAAAADLEAKLAELEAREKALAEREAALASREAQLPKARFTVKSLHRLVVQNPAISDAELEQAAKDAGVTFKAITLRTQKNLALSLLRLVEEAGWRKPDEPPASPG